MKKIIVVFFLLSLVPFNAFPEDKSPGRSGYTVFLDAEQGRGFVFRNLTEESILIVIYPTIEESVIYSDSGKWTNSAAFVYNLIHLQLQYIDENTIANIIPNFKKYKEGIRVK